MAIKDRIKELRLKKDWSQAELGEKMGIHQKQVSAYERGRNIPSTEVLMKLAEIFDVSLDYLASEAEGKEAKIDIKDRILLKKFEEVDKLNEKDKVIIIEILNTFILKDKFQNLANQSS
ncbi:MAG: helix-turn-helix transcriptional regulator [Desulfobacterales bacterium]|nr:helix-turn-helix transcriptional regulator [Desulfobacterales bacterium]